jgi:hypothetical protein
MSNVSGPFEPFAIIPQSVIDHPDLTARALRLYACLARYVDADRDCVVKRSTLAQRARCSEDTVDRGLAELQAIGALTITRAQREDGSYGPSHYQLTSPAASGHAERGSPQICGEVPAGLRGGGGRTDADTRTRTKDLEREQTHSSTDVDQPVLELVGENADDGFEEVWEAYPRRKGRRAGSKAKAKARWKALKRPQRQQVLVAVGHYRQERAPTGNGEFVMDLARFLGTEWETWVEAPVDVQVAAQVKNGGWRL